MKILIATPIYPPEIGGPATYTKELCERLHNQHQITVITYTDSTEVFPGTRLVAISKQRPLPIRLLKYFLLLLKEAKSHDVIYVQNAVASGLPVAFASILTGIPFVLKFVGDESWERATQRRLTHKTLEDFLSSPEGDFRIKSMMKLQGFVLRRASIVTTPSIYLGEEIQKAYRIKKERVIANYNAAEETETIPFEVTRIPHQIATTARLVAWKGVGGILEAVSLLKDKIPDLTFKIAGDGPELEDLKSQAKQLGITDRVEFLGKVSRAETWRLRKQSEIYILNSTYEGLPHTVLTSFASEIPTIATNISGTNEAIYHEKTGLLVPPGDSLALANAIERLLNDKALQLNLVKNGSELLKKKFSWESHIENLEKFLKSVCANPRNKIANPIN